jgi:aryl-alcohol dehydrogenase-like predicted oxidoreductase
LLDRLLDAGYNAIDTADVYSRWAPGHQGGESETVLGRWMASRRNRDRVLVFTKVGMGMPDGEGLGAAWIARASADSLRRLQTDYIDLYQAHRDDSSVPLDETLTAFGQLVASGRVRAIGASNYTGARLAEALAVSARLGVPRYESLQPHYNLVERAAYEADLEPVCLREQLGVINYFALASGFLTGKYRSEADRAKSRRGEGAAKYLNAHGLAVLAALDRVAARHAATPAQVAIAWLVARPSVTAPIASATTLEQLDDLVRGATLALDAGDIAELDAASAESRR